MDIEQLANELYPNSHKIAPHIHITPAIKKQRRLKAAFIKGYKTAMEQIDEELAKIEDYAHGDVGDAISKLRGLTSKFY